MSKEIRQIFEFGPFRIDDVNRQLLRDGELVPLKAKAVDTLLMLIEHRGDVVEKDELMKWLWPDSFVEESNLTQNIYMLRKALGEARYIETVPRRGYRFVADVKTLADETREVLVISEKTRTSISYEENESPGNESVGPVHRIIDVSQPRALPRSETEVRRSGSIWKWGLALLLLVSLCVVAVVFVRHRTPMPFEKPQLTRFTSSGKAIKAAISPDGKYIAHVVEESGQKGVWLRQVATGKDLLIVQPARVEFFYGLTFSHDGNYVYYVNQEMNRLGILFQVPTLGGPPTKLIEDVDSPVTISPDDKRLAFVRGSPGESSLTIANVDGSGERKLVTTKHSDAVRLGPTWTIPPAWSPDGKTIASPVATTASDGEYETIWGFDAGSGAGKPLTSQRWLTVGRMQWLADQTGLLVTGASLNGDSSQQIWHVAYPSGATRKVTNDLSDYRDLSLTADNKTLIAVHSERKANLWLAATADLSHAAQITSTNYDGLGGLAWTPDGKIVYTLDVADELNLWLVDPNEKTPRQLTAHAGLNEQPVVAPDGRYIIFVSNRSGRQHLWRIDTDGKHPQELTHGAEESTPSISADGHWVIFISRVGGTLRLLRISIDGGEPVAVMDEPCFEPTLSPDGAQIAFVYRSAPAAINQFAIIPFAGGKPRSIRELPAHYGRFGWASDSQALAYADKQEGIGNIWLQPLDGSAPKQLTHWSATPIFSFGWSRDGKWLAYASGSQTSDVVLITDVAR